MYLIAWTLRSRWCRFNSEFRFNDIPQSPKPNICRIIFTSPLLLPSQNTLLVTGDYPTAVMSDQTIQSSPDSPEIIAFASRMYDAARQGDMPIFEQALPAGLPPNMTNDKGDSLVHSSPRPVGACHLSQPLHVQPLPYICRPPRTNKQKALPQGPC